MAIGDSSVESEWVLWIYLWETIGVLGTRFRLIRRGVYSITISNMAIFLGVWDGSGVDLIDIYWIIRFCFFWRCASEGRMGCDGLFIGAG